MASSAMQAKFMACYGAITHAVWLRNFISGLLIVDFISKALKIYCDNSAIIFLSKNNNSSSASKHTEIKYVVVKDLVKKEDIIIEHIQTDAMLVNPLTKGLKFVVFAKHVENIGLLQSFDVLD